MGLLKGVLRNTQWGQVHTYVSGRLVLVATVSHVHEPNLYIEDGHIVCLCHLKFSADREGRWIRETVFAGHTIPGQTDGAYCELTETGRLVIRSGRDEDPVMTVIFPLADAGIEDPELPGIEKADVHVLLATAVEMNVETAVEERSGHIVPYACGHDAHEFYVMRVYGRKFRLGASASKQRELCPDCQLPVLVAGATRCHACRRPIPKGGICYNYEGDIYCESAHCSPGPLGAFPAPWPGNQPAT